MKAVEQGNAMLGSTNPVFMQKNGRGVKQSDEKSVEWSMKSAKQGHANAQIILDDPNSFSLFSFVTCFIVAFFILAIAMHRRSKTSSAEMHAAQLLLEEEEDSKRLLHLFMEA